MRRAWPLIISAALVVTGVMLLTARTADKAVASVPGVSLIKNVTYAIADDRRLKLDVWRPRPRPEAALPAVIFIHGGGWSGGDKADHGDLLAAVARAGFAVFSINYRLSPQATYPAQIHDCKAAVRWVRANARRYGADGARIGVFGVSAGGHLAALLGTSAGVAELEGAGGSAQQSSAVQAVCDWFGPVDLQSATPQPPDAVQIVTELLGGPPDKQARLARLATPLTFIDAGDPPFLIIHGTADPLVLFEHSKKLHDALAAAGVPVELISVPGGEHGAFVDTTPNVDELTARMIAFFNDRLK